MSETTKDPVPQSARYWYDKYDTRDATPRERLVNLREAWNHLVNHVHTLQLEHETERAKVACAYCNLELDRRAPDFAEKMEQHITGCAKNPMVGTLTVMAGLLEAVAACELKHDENGHAYLKVPARSMTDLGAIISSAIKQAKETPRVD